MVRNGVLSLKGEKKSATNKRLLAISWNAATARPNDHSASEYYW
jgi:hypothetical protein